MMIDQETLGLLFPKKSARMVIQFDWYNESGWQPVFFVLW